MKNSSPWVQIYLAAAAFAAVCPFFIFGQPSGHDIDFHLASWMDVALQWRQGVLFPRWAVWANFGFGEPRFIFYPPLSWCLGAFLGTVLPWVLVPGIFIFLSLLLGGLCMHRLAREWLAPGGATAAAVIYILNSYSVANIYLRSDFAELLASSIFPLAVYYALRGSKPADGERFPAAHPLRSAACLGLTYGAIWLTNAPAAVVATYALALLLATRALQERSFAPLLRGGTGMAAGMALAGVYIVPAALERSWVNIEGAVSAGLRFSESYLYTWTLDPDHNLFNFQISTAAILMIVLAGCAALLSHHRTGKTHSQWLPMFMLALASTAMMFPVSGFAWKNLPELRYVQFPWRWLFPLSVSFAYFLGDVFSSSRRKVLVAAALIVLGLGSGAGIMACAWWNSDEAPDRLQAIQSGKGYDGTDEYSPRGADHYDLTMGAPEVALLAPDTDNDSSAKQAPPAANLKIERWEPERKVFTVNNDKSVRAALRLLNYPAWKIRLNGSPAAANANADTGQMIISLPPGNNRVEVRFGRTADRTAGAALSALAAISILIAITIGTQRLKAELRGEPRPLG